MQGPVIKRVEVYSFSHGTGGDSPIIENIMVRVAARAGEDIIEGWGEGPTGDPAVTGQTREIADDDMMRRVAPAIMGRSFFTADDIIDLTGEASSLRHGMGSAICALDSALFDLLGRFLNLPVCSLMREYLWLAPLKEFSPADEPYPVTTGEQILGGEVECTDDTVIIDGRGLFDSPDQFMISCANMLDKTSAVIQPFHRDHFSMTRKLKKALRDEGISCPVLFDGFSASREMARELLSCRAFDGIVFRPGRDGGMANLLGICDLLKNYKDFILALRGEPSTGWGATALHHMFQGAMEFFHPRMLFIPAPLAVESMGGLKLSGRDSDATFARPGFGRELDRDFLESSSLTGSVAAIKDGEMIIQSFPYLRGKPDFRRVNRYRPEPVAPGK